MSVGAAQRTETIGNFIGGREVGAASGGVFE